MTVDKNEKYSSEKKLKDLLKEKGGAPIDSEFKEEGLLFLRQKISEIDGDKPSSFWILFKRKEMRGIFAFSIFLIFFGLFQYQNRSPVMMTEADEEFLVDSIMEYIVGVSEETNDFSDTTIFELDDFNEDLEEFEDV